MCRGWSIKVTKRSPISPTLALATSGSTRRATLPTYLPAVLHASTSTTTPSTRHKGLQSQLYFSPSTTTPNTTAHDCRVDATLQVEAPLSLLTPNSHFTLTPRTSHLHHPISTPSTTPYP
ncbi:hypothetical protein L207DRAFT_39135 [Hyaloscypha variabilis F]|uniref:Uncharacterized protein n=1 Tax=Hyaloscypha variabilis (strain UAMH 11265 / GT02V1 / F) TaxID=1149755 RepID=A0A2J6RNL4_HYAVF|nr:hypothetical protein L207DRAFT_39135 [Hyaloscypha variabilis F]